MIKENYNIIYISALVFSAFWHLNKSNFQADKFTFVMAKTMLNT